MDLCESTTVECGCWPLQQGPVLCAQKTPYWTKVWTVSGYSEEFQQAILGFSVQLSQNNHIPFTFVNCTDSAHTLKKQQYTQSVQEDALKIMDASDYAKCSQTAT